MKIDVMMKENVPPEQSTNKQCSKENCISNNKERKK